MVCLQLNIKNIVCCFPAAKSTADVPPTTNIRRSLQQLPREALEKSETTESASGGDQSKSTNETPSQQQTRHATQAPVSLYHPASLNGSHTTTARVRDVQDTAVAGDKQGQQHQQGASLDDSRQRHTRQLTPGRRIQRTVSWHHLPSLRHTGHQHSDVKPSSLHHMDTQHLRPQHYTIHPDWV